MKPGNGCAVAGLRLCAGCAEQVRGRPVDSGHFCPRRVRTTAAALRCCVGYPRANASSSTRRMSVHPFRCPSTAFGGKPR